MRLTKNGYAVGQSGKLATCPFCLDLMCGCYDCLEVNKYRCCKGCAEQFRMEFGKPLSKRVIRTAIKRLIANGLWDRVSHSVPKVA